MYVTLTDIQNGKPVSVPGTAGRGGGLEVALRELTYYHQWSNISAVLGNNQVSNGHTTLMIPDGYYNVCELDEEAFRRLDAKLRLHYPTGRMQLRPGNVQGNNNEIVIAGSGAATAAKNVWC